MEEPQNKLRLIVYSIFCFVALIILIDFVWPGKIVKDEIIDVKSERQQYYNAAGNYHYSYKVITSQHAFSVEEVFAKSDLKSKRIEYSVSPIFKEVNWYKLLISSDKSSYSLRVVSGLILPLVAIILIIIAYRFPKYLGTIIFILQALLIADLIFLMM